MARRHPIVRKNDAARPSIGGMSNEPRLAQIDWRGRPVQIEHAWVGAMRNAHAPLVVFLHEGLGSVSMWRDFPARLCEAVGARGLVYSRPGYGRSTPRQRGERWDPDFMHRQALEVLPALLAALGIDEPIWLFGHSDGGSIALLHAAHRPAATAGAIVLAPHIHTEPFGLASIAKARIAYESGGLRERLARHHVDPDSAFYGWNDAWLDPRFATWNIEAEIDTIACPLLAVQGLDDEYGTLEQIRGIARRVPQTKLLELPGCGHSPHRDRAEELLAACARFVASTSKRPLALPGHLRRH
jgi:pimeloyl-ACP methyl ester carboxylesterase